MNTPELDADDDRLASLHKAFEYVPLNQYDEVTKLAEYALGDFIRERDAARRIGDELAAQIGLLEDEVERLREELRYYAGQKVEANISRA